MMAKIVTALVPLLCGMICAASSRAAVATASPPVAPAIACPSGKCRDAPEHAKLMAPDGRHEIDVDFAPAPYVSDGAIVVFPGETLVFRFSGGDGGPGTPSFEKQMPLALPQNVPPNDASFKDDEHTRVQHDPKTGENLYIIKEGSPFAEGGTAQEHLKDEPPNTMIVSYHQVSGRADMVLRIEHNFSSPLKYDAEIEPLRSGGRASPVKTSTCPVMPVLSGTETWPYPLGAITLKNFRFLDTGKGFNCD